MTIPTELRLQVRQRANFALRKYDQIEEQRLLMRYRAVVALLEQLYQQQAALLEKQHAILDFLLRRTE